MIFNNDRLHRSVREAIDQRLASIGLVSTDNPLEFSYELDALSKDPPDDETLAKFVEDIAPYDGGGVSVSEIAKAFKKHENINDNNYASAQIRAEGAIPNAPNGDAQRKALAALGRGYKAVLHKAKNLEEVKSFFGDMIWIIPELFTEFKEPELKLFEDLTRASPYLAKYVTYLRMIVVYFGEKPELLHAVDPDYFDYALNGIDDWRLKEVGFDDDSAIASRDHTLSGYLKRAFEGSPHHLRKILNREGAVIARTDLYQHELRRPPARQPLIESPAV